MRIKYLTALTSGPAENRFHAEYRGFNISGKSGAHYFVDGLPHMIFTSVSKAKEAIDRCLALRAELSN